VWPIFAAVHHKRARPWALAADSSPMAVAARSIVGRVSRVKLAEVEESPTGVAALQRAARPKERIAGSSQMAAEAL
jgi:hypothetical protein